MIPHGNSVLRHTNTHSCPSSPSSTQQSPLVPGFLKRLIMKISPFGAKIALLPFQSRRLKTGLTRSRSVTVMSPEQIETSKDRLRKLDLQAKPLRLKERTHQSEMNTYRRECSADKDAALQNAIENSSMKYKINDYYATQESYDGQLAYDGTYDPATAAKLERYSNNYDLQKELTRVNAAEPQTARPVPTGGLTPAEQSGLKKIDDEIKSINSKLRPVESIQSIAQTIVSKVPKGSRDAAHIREAVAVALPTMRLKDGQRAQLEQALQQEMNK